jgi:hypothetical protein
MIFTLTNQEHYLHLGFHNLKAFGGFSIEIQFHEQQLKLFQEKKLQIFNEHQVAIWYVRPLGVVHVTD